MSAFYLFIGSGRVCFHLRHYFELLHLPIQTWSRREPLARLKERAREATHILVLISDPAIVPFIEQYQALFENKTLIHMSGSLSTPMAEGAHPLMAFTPGRHYDLDTYKSIPFILECGGQPFENILPGLPNPHWFLPTSSKPLYHALCVLSGNFTTILWQKTFSEFRQKFDFPPEVLLPYLERISANLHTRPDAALTGPIARRDAITIEKNLSALQDDAFADIYRAFVAAIAPDLNAQSLDIQLGSNSNGGSI